ncbi:type VI secretion system baseplate subunit TssE [Castellaniella denitrificans]|uniref:Type VI secretion system baseplate subunit TssE n=1 Tax=Castellaniella denitrificans TaxID=56119 RepID=A0ABT4M3C6_9BURK|nr:type VI secretion system baseplate subunit TssE [Castellaniella denitrificans]MCZ4329826.1 type VI secretion system baseplate subunit TssE [Castellaniella denitrificans]
MSQIRLLERLTHFEDPGLSDGVSPDRQLSESIGLHLTRLLNTRAGSVPIDAQYGLADMSNIAGSFAVGTSEALSEAILRQISLYEPRLRQCRISVSSERRDVIALRFELSGLLAASRANAPDLPFSVSLRINSAGRIFVDRLARH